ncbi:hypothetical protein BG74_08180, partial [Sodalis-like endosymbiont of Proechinophthirus fluctus]
MVAAIAPDNDLRRSSGNDGMNKKTKQRYPDGLWLNGAWTGWILALAAHLTDKTVLCAVAAFVSLGLLVLYFVKNRMENWNMFGKK